MAVFDSDEGCRPSREPGFSAANLGLPFTELLPITGVAISVFDRTGTPTTLFASDSTAAQLDDMQFDLGEGPIFSAYRSSQPVQVADVSILDNHDWPVFRLNATSTDARALMAIPLMMGAVCVGVASLHRLTAGALTASQLVLGLSVGRSVAGSALRWAGQLAEKDSLEGPQASLAYRREVHQATGMALVQLNTNATEAFDRLRAHAFVTGKTLHEVAAEIISHQLDLSLLPD